MPAPKDPIERLVAELSKLPGIGRKTATRLAFHILKEDAEYAGALSRALTEAKERVGFCEKCFNYAVDPLCTVCSSAKRDPAIICVVEQVPDLMALESAGGFRGLYHVLHGVLSPLDSVGPEKLRIAELMRRLDSGEVREVILATGTGVEGEATALYLAEEIRSRDIAVSRIAYGVPIGGELEYIDRATLTRALEGRTRIG
ncbi:MAG: recombination protein RecR [Chrysiogenetes bacterium]|nr:recombination protein RecR [Chrysiogenetes bacterium]